MMSCDVCGATETRMEWVSEVFIVEERRVLVEGITARVCLRCGELTFSRETTEKVRRMVHGELQ